MGIFGEILVLSNDLWYYFFFWNSMGYSLLYRTSLYFFKQIQNSIIKLQTIEVNVVSVAVAETTKTTVLQLQTII